VLTFHAWGSCQRFKASGAITLAGKPSFDHHHIRSNNLKPPGFQLYMLVISVKQGINTMLVIFFFFFGSGLLLMNTCKTSSLSV
jgi:hypothetical protein